MLQHGILVFALITLACCEQFHVRVRFGDTRVIAQLHSNRSGTQTEQNQRIFLFNASSEAQLREELARATGLTRTVDSPAAFVIARVRPTGREVGSWGQDRIDQRSLPLDGQYNPTGNGAGVTAWVVDTGVDASHPDFGGRATNVFAAYDPPYDCDGHGTHVSSTLGGTTYGVASAVEIRAGKALNCDGSGTTYTVAQVLQYVLDHLTGADVINLSLGYSGRDSVIESLLEDLMVAGAFVSASAGNENANACGHFPSSQAGVASVAASTDHDVRASFSNYGSCVDIFAPGTSIRAAKLGGGTIELSGTSMSSPHVAGSAAIYMQAHPGATPAQILNALTTASTKNVLVSRSGSPDRLDYVGDPSVPQPSGSGSGSAAPPRLFVSLGALVFGVLLNAI